MPFLDKKWFRNENNLSVQLTKSLIAPDLGRQINAVLGKFGWQGEPAAGVAVELSADNRRVSRAQFFLRGMLSREVGTLSANKIWEKADKAVLMAITFPNGEVFPFTSGTLASEYVPSEEVKVACSKNGTPLLPTDYGAHGIGDFCMRTVAYLDKSSNTAAGPKIKFTVLCFPENEETMRARSEMTDDVGWPGIKVLEGQAELAPSPPAEGWGCPLLPVIVPGTDPEAAPIRTSGDELRFAVGKVMATARLPTPCATAGSMAKKWEKIQQDPLSCGERMPSVVWPATRQPPPPQSGKIFLFGAVRSKSLASRKGGGRKGRKKDKFNVI